MLHGHEDGHQGHFHLVEKRPELPLPQFRCQGFYQAIGHVGVGSGIWPCLAHRHLGHTALGFARANEFFDPGHLDVQSRPGQAFQTQVAAGRIQNPFRQHGVKSHALDLNIVLGQHQDVVFGVVGVLGNRRVFQYRPEPFPDHLPREL